MEIMDICIWNFQFKASSSVVFIEFKSEEHVLLVEVEFSLFLE